MMNTLTDALNRQLNWCKNELATATRKTYFDQAFGGLSFAIQMCGNDWDEANRYVDLWSKVWYAKFVKVVYDYDVEV